MFWNQIQIFRENIRAANYNSGDIYNELRAFARRVSDQEIRTYASIEALRGKYGIEGFSGQEVENEFDKILNQYYGLFDINLNQSGKGIPKRPSNFSVKLEDILNGKNPDYPDKILKKRLIDSGLLEEECSLCSWNEERVVNNKICLHLDYIDDNKENKDYDNLKLLCPNCYFTNVGEFLNSKKFCK